MASKTNLKNFIQQASSNIIEDRAATKTLLMSLMKYMQVSEDRHKEVGLVAAKYLETLQRSNEQLVKLASLMQRQDRMPSSITEEDKQDLFDLIKSDVDNEKKEEEI